MGRVPSWGCWYAVYFLSRKYCYLCKSWRFSRVILTDIHSPTHLVCNPRACNFKMPMSHEPSCPARIHAEKIIPANYFEYCRCNCVCNMTHFRVQIILTSKESACNNCVTDSTLWNNKGIVTTALWQSLLAIWKDFALHLRERRTSSRNSREKNIFFANHWLLILLK